MTPAFSRADCEAIVRRLWPYLDGKLPDWERERVAHHLSMCRDCVSHFDFAQAFLEAVHAARPESTEDEALRQRILTALAAEGFAAKPPSA